MENQGVMLPKLGPVIAIDGPAGTGKSSATKRLADALGFVHIDTGALYRAIAYKSLERQGSEFEFLENAKGLAREAHLEFKRDPKKNPSNRVLINGEDVTSKIRTPEVSLAASRVSSLPEVRSALLSLQRRLGCQGRSILEGRDIGTVIFPDADLKFFLNASVDERAKRRLIELEVLGQEVPPLEELRRQIEERDTADRTRAIAPLKKAVDAIEIDTTALTLEQVISKMEEVARKKLGLG